MCISLGQDYTICTACCERVSRAYSASLHREVCNEGTKYKPIHPYILTVHYILLPSVPYRHSSMMRDERRSADVDSAKCAQCSITYQYKATVVADACEATHTRIMLRSAQKARSKAHT